MGIWSKLMGMRERALERTDPTRDAPVVPPPTRDVDDVAEVWGAAQAQRAIREAATLLGHDLEPGSAADVLVGLWDGGKGQPIRVYVGHRLIGQVGDADAARRVKRRIAKVGTPRLSGRVAQCHGSIRHLQSGKWRVYLDV